MTHTFFAREKLGKIFICVNRCITRGKIWEIFLVNLKLQNFLQQKNSFFASSFAFFKEAKKVISTQIELVLRVDRCLNMLFISDNG